MQLILVTFFTGDVVGVENAEKFKISVENKSVNLRSLLDSVKKFNMDLFLLPGKTPEEPLMEAKIVDNRYAGMRYS